MTRSKAMSALFFTVYMVFIMFLQRKHPEAMYVLGAIMGGLLIFSLLVRRSIRFKPYFTSRYNFLTSKIRHQKEFDLPKDILFDKIIEVLTEAGFKMQHADKAAGTLFATTGVSFYSWGENIYLDLTEKNGFTKVDFCSSCFFAITSWGRNEKNYERMLDTFENSMII